MLALRALLSFYQLLPPMSEAISGAYEDFWSFLIVVRKTDSYTVKYTICPIAYLPNVAEKPLYNPDIE